MSGHPSIVVAVVVFVVVVIKQHSNKATLKDGERALQLRPSNPPPEGVTQIDGYVPQARNGGSTKVAWIYVERAVYPGSTK